MRTRQKHPGLSLRQWRFFLFRLLAGHWVDSADYLREAQVRRQAEYTQRNLSSHPSEKKNPSQRWFRKPAINRREFVQLCVYLSSATKASFSILFLFLKRAAGADAQGLTQDRLPGGLRKEGWDHPMPDEDCSTQPSTGHSWAHSSAFPTGKAWVRKAEHSSEPRMREKTWQTGEATHTKIGEEGDVPYGAQAQDSLQAVEGPHVWRGNLWRGRSFRESFVLTVPSVKTPAGCSGWNAENLGAKDWCWTWTEEAAWREAYFAFLSQALFFSL